MSIWGWWKTNVLNSLAEGIYIYIYISLIIMIQCSLSVSAALLNFSLLLVAAVVTAGRLHVRQEGCHAALDNMRESFQNQWTTRKIAQLMQTKFNWKWKKKQELKFRLHSKKLYSPPDFFQCRPRSLLTSLNLGFNTYWKFWLQSASILLCLHINVFFFFNSIWKLKWTKRKVGGGVTHLGRCQQPKSHVVALMGAINTYWLQLGPCHGAAASPPAEGAADKTTSLFSGCAGQQRLLFAVFWVDILKHDREQARHDGGYSDSLLPLQSSWRARQESSLRGCQNNSWKLKKKKENIWFFLRSVTTSASSWIDPQEHPPLVPPLPSLSMATLCL